MFLGPGQAGPSGDAWPVEGGALSPWLAGAEAWRAPPLAGQCHALSMSPRCTDFLSSLPPPPPGPSGPPHGPALKFWNRLKAAQSRFSGY